MPRVGNKKFDYTPAGEKAANAYGKKTGQKVKQTEGADGESKSKKKLG